MGIYVHRHPGAGHKVCTFILRNIVHHVMFNFIFLLRISEKNKFQTCALKTIVVSDNNDGSTAGGDYPYEGQGASRGSGRCH